LVKNDVAIEWCKSMDELSSESKRFAQYKKTILDIIHNVLPNCTVYLFGSRARQDHSEGADIDIAIDCGEPIDRSKIYKIEDELEETTIPLMVDVVDLYTSSDKFKEEVEKDGIVWKK